MIYNYLVIYFTYVSWLYSNICKKLNQFKVSQRSKQNWISSNSVSMLSSAILRGVFTFGVTVNKDWTIFGWILLPNIGGWLSYAAAHMQLEYYYITSWDDVLIVPEWGPPTWMLRWVSILLYTMMGYASYMVYTECKGLTSSVILPMTLYGGQLILNMTWMLIFIRYYRIGLALYNLIGLVLITLACTACFYHINRHTVYLMAPQVVFSLFLATYMGYIAKLNPDEF